ncbi:MAG: preprotein translocase subunit TatC [Sphingomonas sp. SCN 67-18]|uniref:group III truncated hemoglobin n=1 Tax=uncultured Sphingomonas sp. TaxID=158754 RepID=UPI00086B9E20|nr:group III truncated hemoglobin [Sphingomonas sp. SCN 67-18]ODU20950.1 MAG: preprotein translocase subunit TatC [Sphingomonas sp. SCN 67-18]
MNARTAIDEAQLERLIPTFYARVRKDPFIGPVFNNAVEDWNEHLDKLIAFWSSVMLTSGRYKGNPMAAHLRQARAITPPMFDRWLELWAEVTNELMAPDAAAAMQEKAGRISESLKLALYFRMPNGPAPVRAPAPAPVSTLPQGD